MNLDKNSFEKNTKKTNRRQKIWLISVIFVFLIVLPASAVFGQSILNWYTEMKSPKVEVSKAEPEVIQPEIINENINSGDQAVNTPTPAPASVPSTKTTPSKTSSRPFVEPMNKEVDLGNTTRPEVALTLDAGSSATQAPAILKILRENNIRITFFLTGKWAEKNSDIVRQMAADGHTFGNHTYSHKDLKTLSDAEIKEELDRTEAIVKNILGANTTLKPYFRPPYGSRDARVRQVAADAGYQDIYWTVDALDWQDGATNESTKSRILDNAKNGSIFLVHIGDDITPAILQDVIDGLRAKGLEPVTLDALLR